MTDKVSLDRAREVLATHREDILRRYDATGVGIGLDESGTGDHVIRVYLEFGQKRPADATSIEGVAIQVMVTGPIRPLSEQ